jgi:clan AA aspartic protease (TIGR02281 family)
MRSSPIFGGTVIAAVLFGCTPAMEYSSAVPGGNAYLPLPAPLEGETVAQGHLCDAQAITQAVTHKYPDSDPATVEQEVEQLLYAYGCGAPPEPAPASFAFRGSPASQPRTTPSASTSPDEIPIERHGGEYVLPVRINQTITIPFILDTGASNIVIPEDVALTLMRAGALTRDDFLGKGHATLANGSELIEDNVMIRELQVGDHTARDVTASVTSARGDPLLGESFLSKFGTVTIDYNRLVLILSH